LPTANHHRPAVFEFIEAAQRSWRRLKGTDFLPKVIRRVIFADDFGGMAHPHTPKVESRRFDAQDSGNNDQE
jgi:hypothetical protein